jgi:hypothetical protein
MGGSSVNFIAIFQVFRPLKDGVLHKLHFLCEMTFAMN